MENSLKLDIDYLIGVADLHGGSQFSPFPDNLRLNSGNVVRPNVFQRWLNRCWDSLWSFADSVTKGRKTAVAILGDTVEGIHHGGRQLSAAYEDDQLAVSRALLRKHVAGRPLIMVEGTECHDKDLENALGAELGAIPYRKPAGDRKPGIYAWPQVDLTVRGCSGTLRHHFPVTSRPYLEASAFSIQLGVDRIERMRMRMPPPQFLVAAHRHRYGSFSDGDARVVVLPPWQGLTRHGNKVVPASRTAACMAILDFTRADKWDPPEVIYRRIVP